MRKEQTPVKCSVISSLIASSLAIAGLSVTPFVAQAQSPEPSPIASPSSKSPAASHKYSQQKKHPSQASVASKTAKFATIPAAKDDVKKATPATSLDALGKLTGKEVQVVGTVTKIFSPNSNSVVILDFAKDYKTAITAVLKAHNGSKFPDMATLKGKKVLVAGLLQEYHGAPEIVLEKPTQIKIVL